MFDKCGLDADNPPKTTDELFTQAKTMHSNCPDDYLMSRKPGLGDFTLAGVKVLNSDGTKFTFADSSKAVDLIDRYKEAYQDGYMPSNVLNSDYLGNSTLFTQQKVACDDRRRDGALGHDQEQPVAQGQRRGQPGARHPAAVRAGPVGVEQVEAPRNAEAFAQFMTNAKNQEAFAHQVNIFPSTTSSQSDPVLLEGRRHRERHGTRLANEALKQAKVLNPSRRTPR